MKVDLILKYVSAYKRLLQGSGNYRESFKWECLKNFWDHWNLESPDLLNMYDNSFSSQISGSLWQGRRLSAKSVMLQFIGEDPEFVRSMFRDLFDENKDVVLRMKRFTFHCDELLKQLQKTHIKVQQHFHDDWKILSVYLSFRYPEQYTIFDYPEFESMMKKIGLREIPAEYDLERFFKICRALNNFLCRDLELIEIQDAMLNDSKYYQQPSLLLVHDFYWCCARKEYAIN